MGPGFFVSVVSKENPSQPLGDRKNAPDIILNAFLGDSAPLMFYTWPVYLCWRFNEAVMNELKEWTEFIIAHLLYGTIANPVIPKRT